MSIPPLAATTTAAALATRLRQDIDQGRWQAGELLRQEQLASEFGVSRIPVREALAHATRFVALEKAFSVGIGGIVASHVRMAMSKHPIANYTVVAGLGGRAILKSSLHQMLDRAVADELDFLTFLDLDQDVVDREIARAKLEPRPGPSAEDTLRDKGAVRASAT